MHISILIPHWKTGKMTAYSITQLLKYRGRHEIDIHVVDNNSGDGSIEYLRPFLNDITIYDYPKDKLQSHGIAFDYCLPHIKSEYFITTESDSFPTKDNWLDYYEAIIENGIECAGSILQLSGGCYLHPCGAMFKKSNWNEAKQYCDEIKYSYFPNMSRKDGFDCHLMIHHSVLDTVLDNLVDYIEIAGGYVGLSKDEMLAKRDYYKPATMPFHNGMGGNNESIKTYGQRTFGTDVHTILVDDNKRKLINRIGYEPGQFFSYWHYATNKKVFSIPTEIKWVNGQEGRQQEYTLMENGFRHIWGVSAYKDVDPKDEVAKIKQAIPEQLYNSLPDHQKIKL